MQINKETAHSPPAIFFAYVAAASFLILIFRLIFPGEIAPLPIFTRNWRLIRALLDIIALFPALAFSALVLPFGIVSEDDNHPGYAHIFQRLMSPLVTAICAAVLYAILFFLILPLTQNYEENLRYQGDMYRLAKERAEVHKQNGDWLEVSQFIGICDSVWKDSPETAELRSELEYHMDELRLGGNRLSEKDSVRTLNSASLSALPGQREPVDAAEAVALGETALAEERFFDAHWLATLGGRIAKIGSPESTQASWLAARAWNQIESLHPTKTENRVYSIYQLKLSGYEAMVAGDWIRAYYIFKELLSLTPNDPDARNFFAACEKGTTEIAFFIDEMEVSVNETLTNVIFSLPARQNRGQDRSVMRVASFSFSSDYAYGTGIEYMVFDTDAHPLLHLQAPYAKFLPITLGDQERVIVLMRALDRNDRTRRWEPEWSAQNNTVYQPHMAQITLNIDYETFLMLPEMRQGLPSLHIDTLFAASDIAGETGYIPEVFEAEILNRLGSCLFFLPMSVVAIVIGWCYRAKRRPRYFFVLLLPVLPVVFNGMVYLYRIIFNSIGISLILNLGFSLALIALIAILAFSFILSLILLAAQRD
ncbi:MAG: hypothetical protein LBH20_00520 [Treponema sp.]|jgi:hypothetical protein|nr:hypothetical protein [Treponema sp.]